MSAKQKRQEEMDKELSEAIENMEKACDSANGVSAQRVRGRTTKVRMYLMSLLDPDMKPEEADK